MNQIDTPSQSKAEVLRLFDVMVTARQIELECIRLSGHWYAAIGEEAIAAGAYSLAEEGDVLFPHYRGALVVHWLRGRPLEDIFLSVLAKKGASSQGRHIAPLDGWLEGDVMPWTSYMLGPNIPFGAGNALALKYFTEDRVALVGLGDGTAGTGDFHEGLNMASALELPVVYICHNNQFSISTRPSETLATECIADWARGYRMPAVTVDGNNTNEIREAVQEGIARARKRGGPSFVECMTYRRTGHFASDLAEYRDAEELAMWEKRDPLDAWEFRLIEDWSIAEAEIATRKSGVISAVQEAAARAELAPNADASDLALDGVYAS